MNAFKTAKFTIDKLLQLVTDEASTIKQVNEEIKILKAELKVIRWAVREAESESESESKSDSEYASEGAMSYLLSELEYVEGEGEGEAEAEAEASEAEAEAEAESIEAESESEAAEAEASEAEAEAESIEAESESEAAEAESESEAAEAEAEALEAAKEGSELELAEVEKWLEKADTVVLRLELVVNSGSSRNWQFHRHHQHSPFLLDPIAREIQDITAELRKVRLDATIITAWRFKGGPETNFKSLSITDQSELVDVDSQKEKLVAVLVGEKYSARLVVSLLGTGGVGKTTLADIVYWKQVVQQHFDCTAWIAVSQSYNLKELLKCLATKICLAGGYDPVETDEMQLQELSSLLNQILSMKRYLIVFDDVWHKKFWEDMNHALPNNNVGSRIIITTRDNTIAASASDIVQSLQPLPEEKALELFCNRTFRLAGMIGCPLELEGLSLEIVRRCHGLPLIILSIAGLLINNQNLRPQWEKLLPHFNVELVDHPFLASAISRIFYLSYSDLPFHIRPCFLYFGLFPKDYLVPDQKLFKLWIAEGLITEELGMTLEQVAETYLNELINRSLVQVSYINYYSNERMCRVYGFMHDIILSMAEDFGIRPISNRQSSGRMMRRLSINVDVKDNWETLQMLSSYCGMKEFWETIEYTIRSVFFFNVNELISRSLVVNLFVRLECLELLDFENAPLGNLPDEVGNLIFLKYLSLKNTQVKKLPESVGLLLNLQTLDVRNTLIQELPIQIRNLRKLQHLLAGTQNDKVSLVDLIKGVKIKDGIGYLVNLQTLLTVEAHSSVFGVIEGLEKLRRLRCLSISKLSSFNVNRLFTYIEKMYLLESLSLYSSNVHKVFNLKAISSPPPFLRHLILTCRLKMLPGWISRLQNLSVLGLSFTRLSADPLKALHSLANLVSLSLHQAYIGEQLHFNEGSFQKLKQLVLTELSNLRVIKIEAGALPLLEELRIGPCPLELSSDIQHLRNIQVLEYFDMPNEFVLHLQPGGGSDYLQVEHVPSVIFHYRTQGRNYLSYKLGDPSLLARLEHESPSFPQMSRNSSAQLSFFSDDIED